MKETIEHIESLLARIESALQLVDIPDKEQQVVTLEQAMQAPGFWDNRSQATIMSKQAADLKTTITDWQGLQQEVIELLELAQEDKNNLEVNLRKEIDEQYGALLHRFEQLELQILMNDEHDTASAILTIHAGAGGDDAQDWAEMLSRMYLRWAERHEYTTTIIDATRGTTAGIKSITIRIAGVRVYGQLKAEHGVHRLVRLSPFDADNARHTSFALVEVLPELADIEDVVIDEKDLRIDTYRSSGAGGQHVNVTDSAVRIVHIPTNITVSCQNERSQAANKETAMKILHAKLQQLLEEQRVDEIQELKGEHKQAAWGNQIRSYVLHPYKMVKDLRTEYEESNPDVVLDGNIDVFIEKYLRFAVQARE